VFEVDDDSFNAALAAAGVGWQSDDRKFRVTFFWDAQSEHVDAVG
jgi:hypothetical protein